jgi:hypothetical protein
VTADPDERNDMKHPTRTQVIGALKCRPADWWIDHEEGENDLDDIEELVAKHPGAQLIIDAFEKYPDIDLEWQLGVYSQMGFDPRDPDVIQKAINYCIAFQYAERTGPPGLTRGEWELQSGGVVYYMRIGNRVKIGTTGSLKTRLEKINPEELITVERGGSMKESERHRQFAALRVNGEWFRMEEPLMAHIRQVAAAFKGEFGMTLAEYTNGHRLVTGLTCETTRSHIRST